MYFFFFKSKINWWILPYFHLHRHANFGNFSQNQLVKIMFFLCYWSINFTFSPISTGEFHTFFIPSQLAIIFIFFLQPIGKIYCFLTVFTSFVCFFHNQLRILHIFCQDRLKNFTNFSHNQIMNFKIFLHEWLKKFVIFWPSINKWISWIFRQLNGIFCWK